MQCRQKISCQTRYQSVSGRSTEANRSRQTGPERHRHDFAVQNVAVRQPLIKGSSREIMTHVHHLLLAWLVMASLSAAYAALPHVYVADLPSKFNTDLLGKDEPCMESNVLSPVGANSFGKRFQSSFLCLGKFRTG
ncbi:hypothetical protein WJX73_006196 [Symbiochloris irregularis]|uniref:Uncharacterized protein n=1 Tax=Symbiochloris irregularis TaxID=706552 RepID=A0AAW1PN57_9CHLO